MTDLWDKIEDEEAEADAEFWAMLNDPESLISSDEDRRAYEAAVEDGLFDDDEEDEAELPDDGMDLVTTERAALIGGETGLILAIIIQAKLDLELSPDSEDYQSAAAYFKSDLFRDHLELVGPNLAIDLDF